MEDEQRFGHMVPGRISGRLRDALGLKRFELPMHIYKMRVLGYPPAWLEEARISHSGISLFDSSVSAILYVFFYCYLKGSPKKSAITTTSSCHPALDQRPA